MQRGSWAENTVVTGSPTTSQLAFAHLSESQSFLAPGQAEGFPGE